MRQFVLAVAVLVCFSVEALAWGPEGHETVAMIAEKALSPAAQTQVKGLLGTQAASLGEISNWADQIRPSRPATAPWHYVDIPLSADGYDPQRDCKANDCVVAQISLKAKQLADPALLPAVRLEALKWVVHLVGDVHQPLHCADNGDRGGNEVKVVFAGRTVKLHQVWDSGIIDAAADDHDDYASRLFAAVTPSQRQQWTASAQPADWANQCFAVAKTEIYEPLGLVGHPGPQTTPIVLGTNYADSKIEVVETQLKRAGIRLAALLNAAFGRGMTPRPGT